MKKGDEMQISYEVLLKKIEEKVHEAKLANSETKVRESIQAIKTLCEVILEDSNQKEMNRNMNVHVPSQTVTNTVAIPEKKLEVDDGANGDSIFDF